MLVLVVVMLGLVILVVVPDLPPQRLEGKCLGLGETLQELDTRYLESELGREQGRAAMEALQGRVEAAEGLAGEAAGDARIEREWRERLQEASMADRDGLATARQELDFLRWHLTLALKSRDPWVPRQFACPQAVFDYEKKKKNKF